MTPEQVHRELAEYREAVVRLAERYVAGERSTLYREVREIADALSCLAEEAPESMREAVLGLLERAESLLRFIAN